MIWLNGVSDSVKVGGSQSQVFREATVFIGPGRYLLLARNPAMRKPCLDLLAGLRPPKRGSIMRAGSGSWVVGRAGFIRGRIDGNQLLQFLARIYGLDLPACERFMSQLLTNPEMLQVPIEHWSAMMRLEFNHAIALLPAFDVYWAENALKIPPSRFSRVWHPLFANRLEGQSLVLSTRAEFVARRFCDKALVLDGGRLYVDEDLDRAMKQFALRESIPGDGLTSVDDSDEEEDGADII